MKNNINWNKTFMFYYHKYKGLWIAEQKVNRRHSWYCINNCHTVGDYTSPKVGLYKSMKFYMDKYCIDSVEAIIEHIQPMISKSNLPFYEKDRLEEMYYIDLNDHNDNNNN